MTGNASDDLPKIDRVPTVEESFTQNLRRGGPTTPNLSNLDRVPTVDESFAKGIHGPIGTAPSPFQVQLTVPLDGSTSTLAPPHTDWWWMWPDRASWTVEARPLPGSKVPAALISESKTLDAALDALMENNRTVSAANYAIWCKTDPRATDPFKANDSGKKRQQQDVAYLAPRAHIKSIDDENAAIDARNAKVGGSPLTKLVKPSDPSAVQSWRRVGIHESCFSRMIPLELAQKVASFRKANVPRITSLDVYRMSFETDPRLRELASLIAVKEREHATLAADCKTKKIRADQSAKELDGLDKQVAAGKTVNADRYSKAQAARDTSALVLSQAQANLSACDDALKPLYAERDDEEKKGTISAWAFVVGKQTKTVDELKEVVRSCGYSEERLVDAFVKVCGEPNDPTAREGTPSTVATWDSTFTFGSGFAATTGGDRPLRLLANPNDQGFSGTEKAAIGAMREYLMKCGIYLGDTPTADGRVDIRVVHIETTAEGNIHGGYVITNDDAVPSGLFYGLDTPIGAAYQYMRHRRGILEAFARLGTDRALPEQLSIIIEDMQDVSSKLMAVAFFRSKMEPLTIISLSRLIASRALFASVIHLVHYLPAVFRIDSLLLWIFARRLVPSTIKMHGASATLDKAPLEAKKLAQAETDERKKKGLSIPNEGAPDDPQEGDVTDVDSVDYNPTIENDVVIAKAILVYLLFRTQGWSTAQNTQSQMEGYYFDFINDLRSLDGYEKDLWNIPATPSPASGAPAKPKYPFEKLADYLARTKVTQSDDDKKNGTVACEPGSSRNDPYKVAAIAGTTPYVLSPLGLRDWQEIAALTAGEFTGWGHSDRFAALFNALATRRKAAEK